MVENDPERDARSLHRLLKQDNVYPSHRVFVTARRFSNDMFITALDSQRCPPSRCVREFDVDIPTLRKRYLFSVYFKPPTPSPICCHQACRGELAKEQRRNEKAVAEQAAAARASEKDREVSWPQNIFFSSIGACAAWRVLPSVTFTDKVVA